MWFVVQELIANPSEDLFTGRETRAAAARKWTFDGTERPDYSDRSQIGSRRQFEKQAGISRYVSECLGRDRVVFRHILAPARPTRDVYAAVLCGGIGGFVT